jgi:hypothetical protein
MRVAGVSKPTNESSFCVQGLDVLSDVIYHLETFDVTTIRASTPMFLLARRIKVSFELVFFSTDLIVVLIGALWSQECTTRERY